MALAAENPTSPLLRHPISPSKRTTSPHFTDAVAHVDRMIGLLIAGLEKRRIVQDVALILVGDHGMVSNCDERQIFLDDLFPAIQIPASWVHSYRPLLFIRPPAGVSSSDVVAKMNKALSSGKVENGEYLKMFLKQDLPARLHYSASYRISPIIGLLAEGYKVSETRTNTCECNGNHGYDNAYFSMRTIFVAHGAQFMRVRKIPSFENVEIYNLITRIPGSASFPDSVLLPT